MRMRLTARFWSPELKSAFGGNELTCNERWGAHGPRPEAPVIDGAIVDLPDCTEEFLAKLEPFGRFHLWLRADPPLLHFENDYD